MTDPVSAVSPATAALPERRTAAAAPSPPPTETPTAEPAPARRPLTVDVQRDAGVFVYTLRDPATDTVLAVIPRAAVESGRDGRNVDQRV